MRRLAYVLLALLPLLASQLLADSRPAPTTKTDAPISPESRIALIRTLNAEFVRVKKAFPQGEKGLNIKDGLVTPSELTVAGLIAGRGSAARPGDKAQITNILFTEHQVIFEINGGPLKKAKWYQRIRISSSGGETPIASQPDPNAKGSYVALAFDSYVPNLTPEDAKRMLSPVFDFGAGPSATNQFEESLPPKVRAALKNHEALVGMNHELVTDALGRPNQKIRETDEAGTEYEEWVYGVPPADVQFIRFIGDEVKQVKIMKQDGTKIVRTQKEVDLGQQNAEAAAAAAAAPTAASSVDNRPSLRRPREEAPAENTRITPANAPVRVPDSQGGPKVGPNGAPPQDDPGAPPH